jgi:hypothetical protein
MAIRLFSRRALAPVALLLLAAVAAPMFPTPEADARGWKDNQAPVAMITPSFATIVGYPTDVYSLTSYDPDGDRIQWSWRELSGPAASLTEIKPGQVRFAPPAPGDYTIEVTVTDRWGASSSKSTIVSAVYPPNLTTSPVTDSTTTTSSSDTTTATGSSSETSTVTEPTSTTTTTAPVTSILPGIKGEVASPTVEARLLTDPNVLWVGTWDTSNWQQAAGVGTWSYQSHTSVGSVPGSATGNGLWGLTPAGNQKGFGYHANFDSIGIPSQDDLHYRYRVFFPSDYVWQNAGGGGSGKLPGLAGKYAGGRDSLVGAGGKRWNGTTEVTKSNIADEDGFSARLLWQKDGGLSSYFYAVSPVGVSSANSYYGASSRCKTDPYNSTSANALFVKGAWNTVEMRVKMNTPGVNDGVLQVWMNGKLCLDKNSIQWRSAKRPDLHITQQYFEWFYGGGSGDYPDRDSRIAFDDAVISKGYIGPRVG